MSFTWSDDYYVVENMSSKGNGLFAAREILRGQAIFPFDYWSLERMPMHLTNHSCNPNATFEDGMLIAARDIPAHQEITYNYLAHPVPASPWDFECHCHADNCAGWVRFERAEQA